MSHRFVRDYNNFYGSAGTVLPGAQIRAKHWHSSPRNLSDLGRPLLLYTLTAADAMPYTVNPIRSKYDQSIIRGKPAKWAHHDPRPCLMPPDWSGGYSSIFALQQQEETVAAK